MIAWKDLRLNQSVETKLRRVCRLLDLDDDYFDDEFFNSTKGYQSLKRVLKTHYADSTNEDLMYRFVNLFKELNFPVEILEKYEKLYTVYKKKYDH